MSATEWPADRCDQHGRCHYCRRDTHLRVEPFGGYPACKGCWEQICYGESE